MVLPARQAATKNALHEGAKAGALHPKQADESDSFPPSLVSNYEWLAN
jgi:hypothetical protein